MKRKLIIEVEFPEPMDCKVVPKVVPEEGDEEIDYTEEELKSYREEFVERLYYEVKNYFTDEDKVMECIEESYVEGWDEFSDYGIHIDVKEEPKAKEEKKEENVEEKEETSEEEM